MGPFATADLVLTVWVLSASAILVYMVRRGHSPTRWATISFVGGPFAIPVAVWARQRYRSSNPSVHRRGTPGPGPLAVLVGVDGSAAAHDAAMGAVGALGDRLGRLTLATVIDFESAAAKHDSAVRLAAEATLTREAEAIRDMAGIEARTVVLAGSPATALVEHAQSAGDDWIVIGPRGQGEADWLAGSTAAALRYPTAVPIAIIGGEQPHQASLR